MCVPSWYYRQAAAIPYRATERGLELLLITTAGGKRWIFPKGVIDPHLDAAGAALQEAHEEAGVEGELTGLLGQCTYEKWGGTCHVAVFAMKVTRALDDWPEANVRRRRWMAPADAATLVAKMFRPFVGRVVESLDGARP